MMVPDGIQFMQHIIGFFGRIGSPFLIARIEEPCSKLQGIFDRKDC
jgi:hypothetical protein